MEIAQSFLESVAEFKPHKIFFECALLAGVIQPRVGVPQAAETNQPSSF
jgi:hypothetical protein